MKKYTTPEVEVIKFQIRETIADSTDMGDMSGNVSPTEKPEGFPD